MVKALARQLVQWEGDAAIRHVVVTANGDKAFCAGGDILKLYEMGKAGKAGSPEQLAFFADEYRLNATIKHYPKPYVALIDGIVMGGGVGISVHGSHRVASERIVFAMPEVGIGFFPDVGGTYFLPRMPKEAGMYAALTAGRLKQADCRWAGITTHCVASHRLADLVDALTEAENVDAVLAAFASDPEPAPLAGKAGVIAETFGKGSVALILAALDGVEGEEAEWAQKTAATIRAKSPMSVEIAFRQLRAGIALGFQDCMRLEFRIVSRIMTDHDFYEGVRAVIVDKDNRPQWRPDTLEALDRQAVDAHFEPPSGGDLSFDAASEIGPANEQGFS